MRSEKRRPMILLAWDISVFFFSARFSAKTPNTMHCRRAVRLWLKTLNFRCPCLSLYQMSNNFRCTELFCFGIKFLIFWCLSLRPCQTSNAFRCIKLFRFLTNILVLISSRRRYTRPVTMRDVIFQMRNADFRRRSFKFCKSCLLYWLEFAFIFKRWKT